MVQDFSVRTARTSGVTAHLRVSGTLDSATAHAVCELVRSHLRSGRIWVRIDASGVSAVEDAALDQLAGVARIARADGGGLTMCGVARERLFRTTHVAGPELVHPR